MGCTCNAGEADRARAFAFASAYLASEVVLLMQRIDENEPPSPAASRALEHATEAAAELERLAERGDPLDEAYRTAAWALQAAAVALAEARHRHQDQMEPLVRIQNGVPR